MKSPNVFIGALIAASYGLIPGRSQRASTRGTPIPFTRRTPGPGRNDKCPCGKGKKYKNCCLPKQDEILKRLRDGDLTDLGRVSGGKLLSPAPVSEGTPVSAREISESGELELGGAETHRDSGLGEGSGS